MIGHVVLLSMVIIFGAVTADDNVTCKNITTTTNFTNQQMEGDWAAVSTVSFVSGTITPTRFRPDCEYIRWSNITSDGLTMSLIERKSDLDSLRNTPYQLEIGVGGHLQLPGKNASFIVVDIDPEDFMALVYCLSPMNGGELELNSMVLFTRYRLNKNINEDWLLKVKNHVLGKLKMDQSVDYDRRYNMTCFDFHPLPYSY